MSAQQQSPGSEGVASPSSSGRGPTSLVSTQVVAAGRRRRRLRSPLCSQAVALQLTPPVPRQPSTPLSKQVITVNRVKGLLRDEPEVKSISTEACFAVAKATELFIETLAGRAADKMKAVGRSSLEYSDVAAVVAESETLDWLADVVPQTVKAAALLGGMQQAAAPDAQ